MKANKLKTNDVTYENKNAHSECPKCDSLNTYYRDNVLVCHNCKNETKVRKTSKIVQYLATSLIVAIVLIFINLYL